ncbi:MAG: Rieske (2Fe-2S) protein [Actinobacteria bacterium]|nr:Rieske (2Fe-2S) protein [Actinomycetota bacterium]
MNGRVLKVDSLAIGSTAIGYRMDPFNRKTLFITRTGERTFTAFDSICTHRGGELALKEGVLLCNLHAAQFDAQSGAVLSPPASIPLTPGNIEIVDEILYWVPVDQ